MLYFLRLNIGFYYTRKSLFLGGTGGHKKSRHSRTNGGTKVLQKLRKSVQIFVQNVEEMTNYAIITCSDKTISAGEGGRVKGQRSKGEGLRSKVKG